MITIVLKEVDMNNCEISVQKTEPTIGELRIFNDIVAFLNSKDEQAKLAPQG